MLLFFLRVTESGDVAPCQSKSTTRPPKSGDKSVLPKETPDVSASPLSSFYLFPELLAQDKPRLYVRSEREQKPSCAFGIRCPSTQDTYPEEKSCL